MTVCYDTRDEWIDRIPAVVHRIDKSSRTRDVDTFIQTIKKQMSPEGSPRYRIDEKSHPRPDVLQNRYNALVMTLQGILNAEICYGDKIYLRATDARNRDMTKGMEGRLKVSVSSKGKLLYPTTVSKQRNGGLYHLQDVMKGKFGEVPAKGVK